MTNTAASPISTAARRIQRELRDCHRRSSLPVTVTFDTDGRVTDRVYGQNVSLTGMGNPGDTLWHSGPITLADVQCYLDARAAAAAIDRPEFADELAAFWADNDEDGRARITAERFAEVSDATARELAAEYGIEA